MGYLLEHFNLSHLNLYISTLLTRKGSHAETKAPHENSVSFQVFLIMLSFITLGSESQLSAFKQCQSNTQISGVFFLGGGDMCRCQNLEIRFSGKKIHKALRSVQFLASFVCFYFEILSYLACEKKIIRLASKNHVNQLVISRLSDMLQETLFLLTRYICLRVLSGQSLTPSFTCLFP